MPMREGAQLIPMDDQHPGVPEVCNFNPHKMEVVDAHQVLVGKKGIQD